MRLIFYDIGQTQLFKCGVAEGTAALISGIAGAGASIGGSILGNEQSSSNVQEQLDAQREENQKNRDWQTGEAEKNRNFQLGTFNQSLAHQTSERESSQDYQAQQWEHQFHEELQHRFDVPYGVNPAVYFSGHGSASGVGGSVSAPSNGSPSSPSGSMPSGVAGLNAVGYQPLQLQVPQLMSSLGSMMQGLAAAKQSGIETTFLEKTLRDRIRQAVSNADMAQLGVVLRELDRKFQESSLPDRVKNVAAQYKKVLTDIDLTGEKILTEREEQRLKSVTSELNSVLADYNKSSKKKVDIEITMLPRVIESQILSTRASAAASYASAEHSYESAESLKFERELNEENRSYLSNEIKQEAAIAGKKALLTSDQVRLVHELTRKFELENDWYIANQILNRIQDIVKDVIDVKSLKVKGMPSESSSENSTDVKDRNGVPVYRQHRSSLKKKGKR